MIRAPHVYPSATEFHISSVHVSHPQCVLVNVVVVFIGANVGLGVGKVVDANVGLGVGKVVDANVGLGVGKVVDANVG